MADLETTQAKLRSTPTAGVSGEHSAYYRRLLSAGYKGYIQGSIGGGTLYGTIGLVIGGTVAAGLMLTGVGTVALGLIPALGVGMGLYGAHSFADIGKTAAIIADSADTNEKRRYLLDRYYETPNDLEAAEIKRQLEEQNQARTPEHAFHWRPALIGMAIGLTLGALAFAFPVVGAHIFGEAALQALPVAQSLLPVIGAAVGGLAGAVIGIDREYVRRWLDKAEFTVHESSKAEKEIAARERDIERLTEAARRGEAIAQSSTALDQRVEKIPVQPAALESTPPRRDPIRPASIAGLRETPDTKVRDAVMAERLAGLQHVPNI